MRFQNWWRKKSGKSKTITILATLFILQIGLCFGTPSGVSWYQVLFHIKPSDDPLEVLGIMAYQAILCLVTVLMLVVVAIFWHHELESPPRKRENHDR